MTPILSNVDWYPMVLFFAANLGLAAIFYLQLRREEKRESRR